MRTTVTFDPDVAAAIAQARQERGLGLSAAVNELVRAGLRATDRARPKPFRQQTRELHLRVDVSNVAEALEIAEGSAHR
jgi:hypothetical protein